MPLIKGKSKNAFEHNLKAEMHAGKPQNQALTIAYSMKRKAKKMAAGGEMESGYLSMPKEHEIHNESAINEDDKSLNQYMSHGGDIVQHIMEKRKMAQGGMIEHEDIHHPGAVVADEGEDELSHMADGKENDFDYLSTGDHELDDSSSNSGSADGDELGDHQEDEDRHNIVAMIMKKRKKQHNPNPA